MDISQTRLFSLALVLADGLALNTILRPHRPLGLRLALLTAMAMAAAGITIAVLSPSGFCPDAIGGNHLTRSGNYPNSEPVDLTIGNVSSFINENYPCHLVSPTWATRLHILRVDRMSNQFQMPDWLKLERAARLSIIFIMWFAGSGWMVMRDLRNHKLT